jgi:hypothetical protein
MENKPIEVKEKSLEEAAKQFANDTYGALFLGGSHIPASRGFIAGHNHAINSNNLVSLDKVEKWVKDNWCNCGVQNCGINASLTDLLTHLKP